MSNATKIPGTIEAWETGELGNSLEHAKLADVEILREVEETLAMQMISIRLPKSVIEDFKAIASLEGIGYQPLMREALTRFAQGESRRIMHEVSERQKRARKEAKATHTKNAA
jgi:predicted DNA binding CopG/RHH family protein